LLEDKRLGGDIATREPLDRDDILHVSFEMMRRVLLPQRIPGGRSRLTMVPPGLRFGSGYVLIGAYAAPRAFIGKVIAG
jgi:hypothetical protein